MCRKKTGIILLAWMMLVSVTACGQTGASEDNTISTQETDIQSEESEQEETLVLAINGEKVSVAWEDNESVLSLKKLVLAEPLSVRMSMYGGFEQVGSIGTSLPRNDEQITTEAGDIVLYSGNQIVVFYGSNSWSYTRLGKVTDKTGSEMTKLLGNEDVTITIGVE